MTPSTDQTELDNIADDGMQRRRMAVLAGLILAMVIVNVMFYVNGSKDSKDFIVLPVSDNAHPWNQFSRLRNAAIFINKNGEVKLNARNLLWPSSIRYRINNASVSLGIRRHVLKLYPRLNQDELWIDHRGRIQLVGEVYNRENLKIFLEKQIALYGKEFPVCIFADGQSRFEQISPVLDLLSELGMHRVRFALREDDDSRDITTGPWLDLSNEAWHELQKLGLFIQVD